MVRPGVLVGIIATAVVLVLPLVVVEATTFSLASSSGYKWKGASANASITFDAQVPGVVHLDLIRDGILSDDLMYRYNEVMYSWVPLTSWQWSTSFDLAHFKMDEDDDSAISPNWVLHFDGINGDATVTLNGKLLGSPHSAFVPHKYVLPQGLLREPGRPNILEVAIEPALDYAARQASRYPYSVPATKNYNVWAEPSRRQFMRKAGFDFGWDWGPAFIPTGIEGAVYLSKSRVGRITSLLVHQEHDTTSGAVALTIEIEVQDVPPSVLPLPCDLNLVIRDPEGKQVAHLQSSLTLLQSGTNTIQKTLSLSKPKLWWPVGMGDPNLYSVEVMLSHGRSHTTMVKQFGVRTVELVQEPIEGSEGLSFYFKVNENKVYAKGANMIPLHVFVNAVRDEDMEWLLDSAVAANFNMVRVWGGGIYQPARFYEMCDRKGLMVWQEVMLACALYPRDNDFLDLVRQEVEYQVRRLQSHPSIVLWGGNNENEGALTWFPESTGNRDLYVADYVKLYVDTIYPILSSLDPHRPWVDSSPSNQEVIMDPYVKRWGNVQDGRWGDVHFYDYSKDCQDYSTFPSSRFVSEFGYQSLPSFETLSKVITEEDWNRFSPLMEFRQRHEYGNNEMESQIKRHFRVPPVVMGDDSLSQRKVFDDYLYLTQVQQAVCYETAISHWRRAKATPDRTMGTLYWQLNDVWEGPTWSSIEYGGKWKVLHYMIKRVYSPLLVSALVDASSGQVEVHLTSDLVVERGQPRVQGSLTLQLFAYRDSSQALITRVLDIDVPVDSSTKVFSASLPDLLGTLEPHEVFLQVDFKQAQSSTMTTSTTLFFTPLKDVDLPPAKVAITSVQWEEGSSSSASTTDRRLVMTLRADATAPYVLVESVGIQGYFSDNALTMLAGRDYTLTFTPQQAKATGEGAGLTPETFSHSLQVRSLVDTYLVGASGRSEAGGSSIPDLSEGRASAVE